MKDKLEQVTPNEALSVKIVERLKAESLIHGDDAAAILQKLKSGSATVADWNRWAERKIDERVGGEGQ